MFNKNRYHYFKAILFLCLPFVISKPNHAHEMWIEPLSFEIKAGGRLLAHEKVGQQFKGNSYAYLKSSFQSFDITHNGTTRPINSRLGNKPVVNEVIEEPGLLVISAASSGSTLTYNESAKFERFLQQEGLEWVKEAHKKRGLPETGFSEIFIRFPKALVKVGEGKGQDTRLGLPFEWLVETNPYTTKFDDENSGVKLQLLWQGEPLADTHVNVFNKPNHFSKKAETKLTVLRTDTDGRVVVPAGDGGMFLINAVKMNEASPETTKESGAVWVSLWASLTYALPVNK